MSSSPYEQAAKLVSDVWTRKCSIKTLIYDKKGNLTVSKATYAQASQVLSHQPILRKILQKVSFEEIKNESLLYVLLYEVLLGPNKSIRGGGALKRKIMDRIQDLQTALNEIQPTAATPVNFPRYARVNTMKATVSDVVQRLKQLKIECYLDPHVPDLLVLPPNSAKHVQADSSLSSRLILQDKSSCFSALCLVHGFSSSSITGDVIDACAAPGNKTSHLTMLLAQQTKSPTVVYAFDRSSKRLQSLQSRMNELLDAKSHVRVQASCQDFLQTQPKDFPTVRSILLDPSCSGSGIYTAVDRHDQEETDDSRVETLSNFQFTMLSHAMSFPSVQRIVYSTCSIHEMENEHVVAQALQIHAEWHLVAPQCLASWKHRGHTYEGLTAEDSQCLLRVDKDDGTNGFFVACLERAGSASSNQPRDEYELEQPNEEISYYAGQFDASSSEESSPTGSFSVASKTTTTTTTTAATMGRISKKILKKVEWKKRQRQERVDRLHKKQKH